MKWSLFSGFREFILHDESHLAFLFLDIHKPAWSVKYHVDLDFLKAIIDGEA